MIKSVYQHFHFLFGFNFGLLDTSAYSASLGKFKCFA